MFDAAGATGRLRTSVDRRGRQDGYTLKPPYGCFRAPSHWRWSLTIL